MKTEQLNLDKQVCDFFSQLVKEQRAHIQLQVGFPELDVNGNETVDVIVNYEDGELLNRLLLEAVNKRIELESLKYENKDF